MDNNKNSSVVEPTLFKVDSDSNSNSGAFRKKSRLQTPTTTLDIGSRSAEGILILKRWKKCFNYLLVDVL